MLVLSIPADGSVVLTVSSKKDMRTIGVIEFNDGIANVKMVGHYYSYTSYSKGSLNTIRFQSGSDVWLMTIDADKQSRAGYPGYRLSIDAPSDLIISRVKKSNEDYN